MPTKPTKIQVAGDTIEVEWDAKLGRLTEGYGIGGTHRAGKIHISGGLVPNGERVTLFHELLHNLWEKATLDRFLSTKTCELVLDGLDGWILLMLRSNPELVEFLMRDDEAT